MHLSRDRRRDDDFGVFLGLLGSTKWFEHAVRGALDGLGIFKLRAHRTGFGRNRFVQ